MRINQLDILGFGKWVDKTFQLDSNFHVFYGQNESGKSTIHSFIHSILFGFPTRTQKLNRYEPKSSSKYGGRLHVSDKKYGPVIIERLPHNKVTGEVKLYLANQETLDKPFLNHLLHHTTSAIYNSIFSFDLNELEKINDLKASELESAFLNISVTGTHQYQRIAENLNTNAKKLYKPSGRVPEINQAIDQLKIYEDELYLAESKNKEYTATLERIEELNKQIEISENKSVQFQKLQQKYEYILKYWEDYSYYLYLKYEFQQHEEYLSDDDHQLAETLLEENNRISHNMDQLKAELKTLQKENFASEIMDEYVMNKVLYDQLFENEPKLTEQLNKYHQMKHQLNDKVETNKRLANKLKIHDEVPVKVTDNEINEVKQWQKSLNELEDEANDIDKQLYKVKIQNEHGNKNDINANKKVNLQALMGSMTVFIIAALISFLLNFGTVVSIVVGVIAALPTYFVFGSESSKSDKKSSVSDVDENGTNEKNELTNRMQQVYAQMDTVNDSYQHFLNKHRLPDQLSIAEFVINYDLYNDFVDQSSRIKALSSSIKTEENKLIESTDNLETLSNLYLANFSPEQRISNLSSMRSGVEKQIKSQNELLFKIEQKMEHIKEFEKQLEIIETKLSELFKKYDVKSIVALKRLINESQLNKTKMVDLKKLEQQFSEYEEISQRDLTKERLSRMMEDTTQKIDHLNKNKNEMLEHKATILMELRDLEEGKDYSLKHQKYENQVSQVKGLIESWLVYRAGEDLINLTIKYHTKEQLPQIFNLATKYFNRLTGGKYIDILLEEDLIKVVTANQEFYRVSELSRGTSEPLYAALRLAVINIQAKELTLPILIDDSFVNLDSNRKLVMYDILEEISEVTQVLFFTFDHSIIERFSDNQVTYLESEDY